MSHIINVNGSSSSDAFDLDKFIKSSDLSNNLITTTGDGTTSGSVKYAIEFDGSSGVEKASKYLLICYGVCGGTSAYTTVTVHFPKYYYYNIPQIFLQMKGSGETETTASLYRNKLAAVFMGSDTSSNGIQGIRIKSAAAESHDVYWISIGLTDE